MWKPDTRGCKGDKGLEMVQNFDSPTCRSFHSDEIENIVFKQTFIFVQLII